MQIDNIPPALYWKLKKLASEKKMTIEEVVIFLVEKVNTPK